MNECNSPAVIVIHSFYPTRAKKRTASILGRRGKLPLELMFSFLSLCPWWWSCLRLYALLYAVPLDVRFQFMLLPLFIPSLQITCWKTCRPVSPALAAHWDSPSPEATRPQLGKFNICNLPMLPPLPGNDPSVLASKRWVRKNYVGVTHFMRWCVMSIDYSYTDYRAHGREKMRQLINALPKNMISTNRLNVSTRGLDTKEISHTPSA